MSETARKQHKPLRAVFRFLILIMILCPVDPVSSQSCNKAVKKARIYSTFTKGCLQVESNGRRVVAKTCKENNLDDPYHVYMVTIDKHHMLMYHYTSSMFICWNKKFNKLVGRANPTNLTYCKFEEKPAHVNGDSSVRYTTRNSRNHDVEIAFLKTGQFANIRRRIRCKQQLKNCFSPNFLPIVSKECESLLSKFCKQMRTLRQKGHTISPELMDLCKNEWNQKK